MRWKLPRAWMAANSNELSTRAELARRYPYIASACADDLIEVLHDVPAARVEIRLKAIAEQGNVPNCAIVDDTSLAATLTVSAVPAASALTKQPRQNVKITAKRNEDEFGDLFGSDEDGEDDEDA